tara:strand:+ start:9574 stop:9816 length:243 start_codon:yes stop_codon:yes gene_type:complete
MDDPDEFREMQELIARQFELALRGERPVFCVLCKRPFRCYEASSATSLYRVIYPFRHAIKRGRILCPGSMMQATLAPYDG